MISNVTIGQFYPVDSKIHSLDPRVKIVSLFTFIITLFITDSMLSYFFAFMFLAIITKMSNVPIKMVLKSLRAILFLICFTLVLNICFSTTGTPFFEFGIIRISLAGIYNALRLALRLIIVIIASSLLTLSTSPIKLTDGLEYLFKPLKLFKFPAHDVAMMMTIALRFIPTLMEELDKIMKAQTARGAQFDSGSIITRAKSLVPVLVPLFVCSFRRADELAMAMEARCYRGDVGRTRMKELKMQRIDFFALSAIAVFCTFIIFIG